MNLTWAFPDFRIELRQSNLSYRCKNTWGHPFGVVSTQNLLLGTEVVTPSIPISTLDVPQFWERANSTFRTPHLESMVETMRACVCSGLESDRMTAAAQRYLCGDLDASYKATTSIDRVLFGRDRSSKQVQPRG